MLNYLVAPFCAVYSVQCITHKFNFYHDLSIRASDLTEQNIVAMTTKQAIINIILGNLTLMLFGHQY